MSLIHDYFTKQLYYEEKYGHNTVVVMQRGTFYCIYEYDDANCSGDEKKSKDGTIWEGHIGHAVNLSTILVLRLTKPNNKKKHTFENPDMIGFPVVTYEKVLKTLLANDYVVIRVDQEITSEKDDDDHVPRYVAEIVSPTMNFNRLSLNDTHAYVVSIYIEYIKSKNSRCDGYLVTSGVASIDLITGESNVTEFYSKSNDVNYYEQELYRYLVSHWPKEIVIHVDDLPIAYTEQYNKYLDKILELRRYDRSKININKVNKEFKNPVYQTEFLNKLYNYNYGPKIIEDLDLDKLHYGRIAFLLLIQYGYENYASIDNISIPKISWFDEKNVLVLTHNAALCLEVIPNFRYTHKKKEEINSLLSIMDKTCTPLGKRALENLLLNPMVDSYQIESYYNMVDELLTKHKFKDHDEYLYVHVEKKLKGLADISRLQRQIELKLMIPKSFAVLIRSYIQIIELYTFIMSKNLPHLTKNLVFDIDKLKDFVDYHLDIFNIGNLEECWIDIQGEKLLMFDKNPVKDKDLTNEYEELMGINKKLEEIHEYLNGLVKGKIKLTTKNTNKLGKPVKGQGKGEGKITFFSASIAICNKLKNIKYDKEICGELSISAYSASAKIISSSLIEELCFKKDEMRKSLGVKFLRVFETTMLNIINHMSLFTPLCNLIGKLDVLHNYAKIAHKNKYFRPTILHHGNSFLKIKDIRHPIIEKIIDGEYIVNDVNLGKINDSDISPYGMVLFSTNMSGKSSLLKAVALNILMAQAGSYTPSIMLYRPYNKIITRLSCQDNIFKGESTYAVEIKELRTVLKQGHENTLVIGDEISRSTDSESAICINVSTIMLMLKTKTSFICASHLKEILSTPFINTIDKKLLSINHLTVINDEINDTLIYDRKLKEGSGSDKYGLSVAKYLGLTNEFFEIANKVSLYLDKEHEEYLATKKSKYNSGVYMDHCYKCGLKLNLITHHIQEQHLADNEGYINYMHKNVKDNLQVLCQSCHKNHHYNDYH